MGDVPTLGEVLASGLVMANTPSTWQRFLNDVYSNVYGIEEDCPKCRGYRGTCQRCGGAKVELSEVDRDIKCYRCGGTGQDPPCPRCNGTGKVRQGGLVERVVERSRQLAEAEGLQNGDRIGFVLEALRQEIGKGETDG